ncbi:MAG: hypothetical protein HY869_01165 [Chloroflexi bacterium]|nr:hypothetical protein [Chloroflexota bacterium]
MKIKNIILVLFVAIISASCAPVAKAIPTDTVIPSPTITPIIPTATATTLPTPIPTNTPVPLVTQKLSDIFVPDCQGSVWTNAGASEKKETGWVPYLNDGLYLHFDVARKNGTSACQQVISPVDGKIIRLFKVPGEGNNTDISIQLKKGTTLDGIESVFTNTAELCYLATNGENTDGTCKLSRFPYSSDDIKDIWVVLAHVVPVVGMNDNIEVGQQIGTVDTTQPWNPIVVAFNITLVMKDGKLVQLPPNLFAHKSGSIDNCYSGTPYRCKSYGIK